MYFAHRGTLYGGRLSGALGLHPTSRRYSKAHAYMHVPLNLTLTKLSNAITRIAAILIDPWTCESCENYTCNRAIHTAKKQDTGLGRVSCGTAVSV